MATNFTAKINYKDKTICEIENDNPDLSVLVDFIAKEDDFDEKELSVTSECETFDTDDLTKAIIESVNEFKKAISIDESLYKTALSKISAEDKTVESSTQEAHQE